MRIAGMFLGLILCMTWGCHAHGNSTAVAHAIPIAAASPGFVEGDAPPATARYTIYCQKFDSPDHIAAAREFRKKLSAETGLRCWHLVHDTDTSYVLCGYYDDVFERRSPEYRRAQADRRRIADLKDARGEPRFAFVVFIPINRPDPPAPPEWNLANAPQAAHWSLQIAAYMEGDRKQMAIDSVREARKLGIEAYYYHGETISSVCIGAWPMSAAEIDGLYLRSTNSTDGSRLVLSDRLPDNLSPDAPWFMDGEDPLRPEAPSIKVIDPTMVKAIKDFPTHAVDGQVMVMKLRDGRQLQSPSFVVEIPHPRVTPLPLSPTAVPGT